MKEIFQEYGGILITVVAILAVILVITAVVGTDTSGPIGSAFQTLVKILLTRRTKIPVCRHPKEAVWNLERVFRSIVEIYCERRDHRCRLQWAGDLADQYL